MDDRLDVLLLGSWMGSRFPAVLPGAGPMQQPRLIRLMPPKGAELDGISDYSLQTWLDRATPRVLYLVRTSTGTVYMYVL